MIGACFDSTETLLRAGVLAEAYDEGAEEWAEDKPLEEAAA